MKKKDLEPIADAIVKGIRAATAQLEQRIAALESRPLQKWAGVHVSGMQYAEASLVTHQGSLWAAMKKTTTTPGDSNSDWRLIVKRGKA